MRAESIKVFAER
jgi:hypothetical protein